MEKTKSYQVEKATSSDVETIVGLLKERAQWLEETGSTQWEFLLTGQEDKEIERDIAKGTFFKVISDDKVIATFSLSKEQAEWDIHLWGEEPYENVLYLHKLAVSLTHKGKRVGNYLVAWIKEYAARCEVHTLRLDCVAESEKLNRFYRENEFTLRKILKDHCLYEWRVR